MKKWGLIQIYTGEGKGKTTAALGLAIRAAGQNKKVLIVYFDKGGQNYGERKILNKLQENITYYVTGLNRIDPQTKEFRFGVIEDDKKEAERGLMLAQQEMINYDLLILDEVNTAVQLGMLDKDKILRFIDDKPDFLELVLTGRGCPKEIKKRADLITEMSLIKHYFYKGVESRKGIEY